MTTRPDILFIMFDQLRFDYLSCAGHKTLHTPNFDRLAARGVRFTNAYVQSLVCGPSRMSFYTGRYVSSHGASWNNFPLKVGELTLGDHLRKLGVQSWLIGKTHMTADSEGMDRLGISKDGIIGARVSECGFDVVARDDGLWAEGPEGLYDAKRSPYNEHLKTRGYDGANPWASHANAGVDIDGNIASAWLMKNASLPANIDEPDSETPWLTDRALEFLDGPDAAQPFLCHLSYIKPHWPYIVPAPYHDMYGAEDIQPVVRDAAERADPHPVYEQFMAGAVGSAFQRDEVRAAVIPAYMGLIKQCDDQIGRILDHLEASGRAERTMIVLTSDHGDYLGDHWMGEKDMFHDQAVKVPLIVVDPSSEADATRGTVCDDLVEAIDIAATVIDASGGEVPDHIVEGRSLLPLLRGDTPTDWRDYVISEYDYSATPAARNLDVAPRDARCFMVATKAWKLVHFEGGFRSMLFDLVNDPNEFNDLGHDPSSAPQIARMESMLHAWSRRQSQRTTISEQQIVDKRNGGGADRKGIILGAYSEDDTTDASLSHYVGPASAPPRAASDPE